MCKGKRILAELENFGQISECGCGTFHVSIGPVSVALDSNSLRRLHELVGRAIQKSDSNDLGYPESVFSNSTYLALRKVVKIKH
jgi:hypothetical protein